MSDEMCFGLLTIYPITELRIPFCTTWKNISETQLKSGHTINSCNYTEFSNPSNPNMTELYQQVDSRCPLSHCLEECKEAVKEFKRHPCMQGDMAELMKSQAMRWINTVDTFKFYSKLESCDLEILREKMEAERERESSGGSHVVPQFLELLSLSTLLI